MSAAERTAEPGAVGLAPAAERGAVGKVKLPLIATIFILAIVLPTNVEFFLGPMRVSAYRFLLLVMFLPCLISMISGRAGKLWAFDYFMLAYALWSGLALMLVHGVEKIWQFAGIDFIETLTPYMIARIYIRRVEHFERVMKLLYRLVLIMLPFAAYESLTGHHIIIDTFKSVFGGLSPVWEEWRMGLARAYGPFDHPILYGVFCASIVAPTYYMVCRQNGLIIRWFKTGLIIGAAVLSVSAGALVVVVMQLMLAGWRRATRSIKGRWWLLLSLFVMAYIAISLMSNRPPMHVFLSYLTFSSHTAFYRLLIFDYGSADVARHPFIGIGLNDWNRPEWMHSTSMDNFWLVTALRYGLPSFFFLALSYFLICIKLGRLKLTDPRLVGSRTAILLALTSIAIAGCTVHFWNALYVYIMFLMGAGVWLVDAAEKETRPSEAAESPKTEEPPALAAVPPANRAVG